MMLSHSTWLAQHPDKPPGNDLRPLDCPRGDRISETMKI